MEIKLVRKHIIFKGRVQGVGFRYFCYTEAKKMNLTGYVRNLYDGNVEMEVQGSPDQINELILHLYHQRFIRIDEMQEQKIPLKDEREFRERW